jgi:hypothetical protein
MISQTRATLSKSEFLALVRGAEITTSSEHLGEHDGIEMGRVDRYFEIELPGCDIYASWGWSHPWYAPSEVRLSTDEGADPTLPEVLDEDGDALDINEAWLLIENETALLEEPDMSRELGDDFYLDPDQPDALARPASESSETATVLIRDGEPNFRFVGKQTARVIGDEERGIWEEVALYETEGGRYVAGRIGRTRWLGSEDEYEAWVCEDQKTVVECLGLSDLAKELYEAASVDATEQVE